MKKFPINANFSVKCKENKENFVFKKKSQITEEEENPEFDNIRQYYDKKYGNL